MPFAQPDGAVGDGPGLVEAQDVDAREDLDRGELLDEDPLTGEEDRGEGEVEGRQQDEALGDHADHTGDGGDDGLPPRTRADGLGETAGRPELRPREQERDGHDRDRDDRQDLVDAVAELGAGDGEAAGLGGDALGVGVGTDRGDVDGRAAGDDHRPGEHLVPRLLAHRAGLAREHRLVDLEPRDLEHRPVGGDLVARHEEQEVVEDDVRERHLGVVDAVGAGAPDVGG